MTTPEQKLQKLEELIVAISWQVVYASKGLQEPHDAVKEDRRKYRAELLKMIEEE